MISFKELKQSVPILEILIDKQLDSQLNQKGHRLIGPCPIHKGDNPHAFVVDLQLNLWHCFTGCQTGGDVIELVRHLDQRSYREVAIYLQKFVGHHSAHIAKPTFRPFTRCLPLDAQSSWLRKKGIAVKTAISFEVGEYRYAGFLSGCVGVRLHDLQGQPLGYAGRRLNPHTVKQYGKWKFPKAFPKNQCLYNWHRIQTYDVSHLVLVESPWDVMRLAQLNIPAVALLGLQLSTQQQALICHFNSILLLLDGDKPGRQATQRLKEQLQDYTHVKEIQLADGLNPDDLDDKELRCII